VEEVTEVAEVKEVTKGEIRDSEVSLTRYPLPATRFCE